ncbi:MAG: bifunctional DNA primase/polymerase [Planctomycetota bacterium]|jgi:hypothetical protein
MPSLTSNKKTLLDWALEYHRAGINVVKAYYKGKCPPKGGEWERYETERVTEEQLRQWFGPKASYSNIAAVTGPISGGLTTVDFDSLQVYTWWVSKHPELAATLPTSRSRRGYHVFFRSALTRDDTTSYQHVDIKARGLVSLPPSTHKSGVRYEWITPLPGHVCELPMLDPYEWELGLFTDGKDGIDGNEGNDGNEGVGKGVEECFEGLSLEVRTAIEDAIRETLPKKYGERYNLLFLFARKLKKVEEIKNKSAQELIEMKIADMWHERAKRNMETKSLAMTRARFANAWQDAKYPPGEGLSLQIAWKAALKSTMSMPELEQYGDDRIMERLIRLCLELQRLAGPDDEWFVPTHEGGKLLGISHSWVSVLLKDVESRKIIKETRHYTGRRCTRYVYTGPSLGLLMILSVDKMPIVCYSIIMKRSRKTEGLESQLRQAILKSGISRNQLSIMSGVDPAQLCYFVQGKRSLTLRSAERIAAALRLELRPIKKKGR